MKLTGGKCQSEETDHEPHREDMTGTVCWCVLVCVYMRYLCAFVCVSVHVHVLYELAKISCEHERHPSKHLTKCRESLAFDRDYQEKGENLCFLVLFIYSLCNYYYFTHF